MNRSSLVGFASLAGLLGMAAGCSSSGAGQTSLSAEATCARLSACGLSTDWAGSGPESFGGCTYFIDLVGRASNSAGSDDNLIAAVLNCVTAASNCDELRACTRPTAAQAAVCNTTTQDTCSGNTLVNCSMTGLSQEVTAFDCTKAGLVCGASADGANCGIASCDPASTPTSCNGDLLVTCESQGNVLVSHDCGLEERTCRTNSAGVFDCVGDTPCDLSTSQLRCDGATRVGCGGDTESRVDCSRFGMTCTLEVTSTGDQSSSSTTCTPIDQQCFVGAAESCQNGVISYCNLGLPATFDCHSVGLSGCTTQVTGTTTFIQVGLKLGAAFSFVFQFQEGGPFGTERSGEGID